MKVASPVVQSMNRTFIGSVLFIDIVGYSRRTVPDQLAMKELFNELLAEAIQNVAPSDRIMVDTGDGAAIAFIGDPEDALFAALSLRDAIDAGKANLGEPGFVRMGINLGPLKAVRDINGHTNMIGDGVNDAQRVMSFAEPGQVIVSHSYYDIISRFSHDYTKLFVYEGTRHDKHVREHQVYRFGPLEGTENLEEKLRDRSKARVVEEITQNRGKRGSRTHDALSRLVPHKGEKTFTAGLVGLLVGAASMVGAVWSWTSAPEKKADVAAVAMAETPNANSTSQQSASSLAPAAVAASVKGSDHAAVDAGTVKPTKVKASAIAKTSAQKTGIKSVETASVSEKKSDTASATVKPGTVKFSVQPWGEVYVNGSKRGISPPLKSLSLPPGKYKVEVRNTQFTPYKHTVEVKSGTETTVRYAF